MGRYNEDGEEETESYAERQKRASRQITWLITGVILFLLFLSALFGSFYIVQPGERAVIVRLGELKSDIYGEGLHFKIPFLEKRVIYDIKMQKYSSDATAASKDLQMVTAKMALNFHVNPTSLIDIHRGIGSDYETIFIQPVEQEAIKAATAKFTAEEIGTKREDVAQFMKQSLTEKLSPKGIIVDEVSIMNFEYSPEYTKSIERKAVAAQDALAAKNKLEQINYEAQQIKVKADADAYALQQKKQAITAELVQLSQIEVQSKAIDKWNGNLPMVTGGVMPFIDTNQLAQSNSNIVNNSK